MPDDPVVTGKPQGSGTQDNPEGDKGTKGPASIDFAAWSAQIPSEYTKDAVWTPLKDKPLGEVLKGYAEGQKYIGGSVRIPGADAKPEDIAKFHQKLGVPDSPDKYNLKMPEIPGGWDEAQVKPVLAEIHKLGLTPAQAQGVVGLYAKTVQEAYGRFDTDRKTAAETLKTEWGATYEKNLALAQRVVLEFSGQESLDLLDASGLGNHPALIKLFAKVGEILAEDGVISGDVEGVPTEEEAQRKVNEILADRTNAYWKKEHPGHEAAVQEVNRLIQLAHARV